MLDRLRLVRDRYGIGAMLAVGTGLLVWGFLQFVGAIDTARDILAGPERHWVPYYVSLGLVRLELPVVAAWIVLAAGLGLLALAVVLLLTGRSRPTNWNKGNERGGAVLKEVPIVDRVGGGVWLTWHRETERQLFFTIQNDTAKIINGVQITVTDLGLVSHQHGTRIPVPSAHKPNGEFVGPYTLLDARRLLTIYPGPDRAQKVLFLRREGAKMHQKGHHSPAATREVSLPDRGEWEFDLSLTWDDKALPFLIRVLWTGEEIRPLFLKARG